MKSGWDVLESGDYKAAVKLFLAEHRQRPSKGTLSNLGTAYLCMGDAKRAPGLDPAPARRSGRLTRAHTHQLASRVGSCGTMSLHENIGLMDLRVKCRISPEVWVYPCYYSLVLFAIRICST